MDNILNNLSEICVQFIEDLVPLYGSKIIINKVEKNSCKVSLLKHVSEKFYKNKYNHGIFFL